MIKIYKAEELKNLHTIALEMDISSESLERFWFYFQSHLNIHLMPPKDHISELEAKSLLIRSKAQAVVDIKGEVRLLDFDINQNPLEGCVLFNTSGTTGTPKIIVHKKKSLETIAKIQGEALGIQENGCTAICLPTYHVGAIMSYLRTKLLNGKYLACSYKDETLFKSSIQHLSLVPTQLHLLIKNNHYEFLKNIRTLLIGGAPLEEDLYNKARELGINVVIAHGMSETLAFFALANSYKDGKPVYKALPHYELKKDEMNRLLIKTPAPLFGIISDQGILKKSADEFYQSSDLVTILDNGDYFLHNRADDIIISGGENVSLKRVEIMIQHTLKIELDELKIIVTKDPTYGQVINAFISGPDFTELVNEDYTPKEVFKDRLKRSLSFFEIPKHFFPLPPKCEKVKYSAQDLQNQMDILTSKSETRSLFFLPGFMDFNGNFEDEFPLLKSPYLECFTLEDGDLDKMINEIILKTKSAPIIYGYSQGGRIAFHLVKELARKGIFAKHLFIESAYTGITDLNSLQERKENDQLLIEKISFMKKAEDYWQFLNKWYAMPLFDSYQNTEHYQKNIDSKKRNIELLGFKKFTKKIIKQLKILSPSVLPAAPEALSRPLIPTTIFLGSEDEKYIKLYSKHLNHNFSSHYITPKLTVMVLNGSHLLRAEPESNKKIVEIILNKIMK